MTPRACRLALRLVLATGALSSCGGHAAGPSATDAAASSGDVASESDATSTGDTDVSESCDTDAGYPDKKCFVFTEGMAHVAVTPQDFECAAIENPDVCDANPNCTAVFGVPVACECAAVCAAAEEVFLGCVAWEFCGLYAGILCRVSQASYLDTYYSVQAGGCVPYGYSLCTWDGGILPPDEPASCP